MHALHTRGEMCTDFEGGHVLVVALRAAAIRRIKERSAQSLLHVHNSPKCTVRLVGVQVPPAVAAR